MSKKIVRHIPTQCCYYTEEDGETVIICGCDLHPKLDGIVWEETNEYIEKKPEWAEARRERYGSTYSNRNSI